MEELRTVSRKRGRYGHRDTTMILMVYRYGLRVLELCVLRWNQIDFSQEVLHVNRLKNGEPSIDPHMLRHACDYKLANDRHDIRSIQLYLGHKNIQHTVQYTELSAKCFINFWND